MKPECVKVIETIENDGNTNNDNNNLEIEVSEF